MDSIAIGFFWLAAGFGLVALRVQIGVALGLASFLGIAHLLNMRAAMGMLTAVPFEFVGDWNLTAVPMFLLMGYVTSATGLASGLFAAMRIFLGRLPGGLAITSVGACALLSSASGSSVATSAAFARIAVPEMLRYRYDAGLATGVVASAGTLGSLIPPSILLIVYGYMADVSVAHLFMAGFLPGLLTAVMFSAMIAIRVVLNPKLAPSVTESITRAEKIAAFKEIWPLPVIIFSVLAGIFVGVFSPTEAGAIGAALAIVLALVTRRLSRASLARAILDTLVGTASIFMVVIGTALLARFMALSGVPAYVANGVLAAGSDQLTIILMAALLYLVLGCFLDSFGVLLLTLPIILPLARSVDIDLVYFGIILVKLLEIGLVTPPVGLNVYVIKSSLGGMVGLPTIFRGVGWFIATDIVTMILLIGFPVITLFLPGLMP